MTAKVPLLDAREQPTPYFFEVSPAGADVRVQIDGNYAGRDVDEELSLDSLTRLAAGEAIKNFEALGLTLEGMGEKIHGIIAIGSGNDRFYLRSEELKAALESLATPA